MKGHLKERSPGHWAIVLDVSDPRTGKRRRKWHSFKGTKREAQVETARLIAAIQGGTYLEPSKLTVSSFLESWIEHVKSQVSRKSHERYCELVRKNIRALDRCGAAHEAETDAYIGGVCQGPHQRTAGREGRFGAYDRPLHAQAHQKGARAGSALGVTVAKRR
jgi:hypothetical protein